MTKCVQRQGYKKKNDNIKAAKIRNVCVVCACGVSVVGCVWGASFMGRQARARRMMGCALSIDTRPCSFACKRVRPCLHSVGRSKCVLLWGACLAAVELVPPNNSNLPTPLHTHTTTAPLSASPGNDKNGRTTARKAMERPPDHVLVADAPIDLKLLVQKVGDPGAGAIATFLGVTRDNFNGKPVVRLEYEGYVPMAEKVMHAICAEVRTCVLQACMIGRL